MTKTTNAMREEAIVARLMTLRDELIVRNHLATMEVKEAVHALSAEVERTAHAISARVGSVAAELSHEGKLRFYVALFDNDARLLEMEAAIKSALAGAMRSARFVAETARMKTALARMDAADAMEERRKALGAQLHLLEERSVRVIDDIEKRLESLGISTTKII